MGTIAARKRQDGSTGYTARVRIKRSGKIVHAEAQTFNRKQEATAWLRKREGELEAPGGLERVLQTDPPLSEAIDRYIAESKRALGGTKKQVLRTIKADPIASLKCSAIGSSEIVSFAQRLKVKPQTVSSYLSHLKAIFVVARPAWNYPLSTAAMDDALAVARRLGVTGKGRERNRRPTLEELDTLLNHFSARGRRLPESAPMHLIIPFAMFSTRRQEEITMLKWSDYDQANHRIMVRDMKHPGQKLGNDNWCDLTPEAERFLNAMPRNSDRVFPYSTDAISAGFTRACSLLGVEDLHFHDLRHEGVSRLFEMDWTIPRVATVSGHRSWSSLKRYTQYKKAGDKFAGWKWFDILVPEKEP